MLLRDDAARELGMQIAEMREGYAALTMTVRPEMTNGHDVCHGGMLFALADTAMAYASNSRNGINLAMNASIEFMAPGYKCDTVKAVATEVHRSGRTGAYNVKVENQSGDIIAWFKGRTYQVKGQVIDDESS